MTPIKILSLFLCFCLIFEQSVFAQTIDLSHYFARNPAQTIPQSDKFRPLHLRYISYDNQANDFKILLDKGDFFNQQTPKLPNSETPELEKVTQEVMKYFFIGLSLPNEKFWVNLRPDSPDNILDPDLEKTDIGRIFLEADLQLKKDTSSMTSPQTKEGKEYWDKLYKKAGELFGTENIDIPTITRPWIVPDEVILRESPEGAYIYKATLKVMLEEDYLNQKTEKPKDQKTEIYNFSDPRLKELNKYSTWLIKESIIPSLTREINSSRRYAPLRQVYYSLILAQWFKEKYGNLGSPRTSGVRAPVNNYIDLIDSGNLANLASRQPYDKQNYFQQYQKSFQGGEYSLQEPVYTPMGQSIRRYMSGGMRMDCSSAIYGGKILGAGSPVFGNLTRVIKKCCIYLSASLSITIFPATFAKALTIDKSYNQGLRFEAVVGNERSKAEVLNEIGEELSMNPKTIRKFIGRQGEEPVKPNDRIDVTALFEAKYVEDVLKKCKVVLKKSVELDGKTYDVYFITGNSKDEALRELGGSMGDTIFINVDLVEIYSKKMEKIWGKIYPSITTKGMYDDVIRGAIVHELMHGLLYELFRQGLKTPYLDNVLNGRLGEIPPIELYQTKQELLVCLAEIKSLLHPKIRLADFITSLIEKENNKLSPAHSNAYENSINVILFNDPKGKDEKWLVAMLTALISESGRVSDAGISIGSMRALKEYLEGEDIDSKLSTIQKIADSLLHELKMLRNAKQGNSVKLLISPALSPKINNPKPQQENPELKAKTVAEVLEMSGFKKAFDEGKIVVRLESPNGSSRVFYKNLPSEKQQLEDGDTIHINSFKGGGSSPVSTSSALELGWVNNKIPEDEKQKIGEILGRCEMLRGFKGKIWIQFGSMEGANLIEEEGYFPSELKKQAKEGDGSITIPESFPLFAEKQKEAVLWYLAAVLAYGAAESYGERFAWSVLEEIRRDMLLNVRLQLKEYSWGMDGGDLTMKKWNLIDWISTPLILTKMIKDGYSEQVEAYVRYLESAGKIYVTNNEAIEDEMSRKRGDFLLFVKEYIISVLPFKLTNNGDRAGTYLKRIEEIYGISEEVCIPGNIKDLINNSSYPDDFVLGKVAEGINKKLNSFLGISGSPVASEINPLQSNDAKGGIDLSRINKSIRAESLASPGAGGLNSPVDVDFDLNEELGRLQNMLNAEIIPSASRLDRYARAACASSVSSPDSSDNALSLVAETFRLQEEKAVSAPAELKTLAAWLEQAGQNLP